MDFPTLLEEGQGLVSCPAPEVDRKSSVTLITCGQFYRSGEKFDRITTRSALGIACPCGLACIEIERVDHLINVAGKDPRVMAGVLP
jgi:hypothetical protein